MNGGGRWREGEGEEGAGAAGEARGLRPLDDEDPHFATYGGDAHERVVRREFVLHVERRGHRVGARRAEAVAEGDRPSLAGLELADGGVGVVAPLDGERDGARRRRLFAVVGDGDVDAHLAVGADDVAGEGDSGDGEVAEAGGDGEGAPDDLRASGQMREKLADARPGVVVAQQPALGLSVADDEDLLVAVVALRKDGGRKGEGVGGLKRALQRNSLVEKAEEKSAVGRRRRGERHRHRAAHDDGEGRVARA